MRRGSVHGGIMFLFIYFLQITMLRKFLLNFEFLLKFDFFANWQRPWRKYVFLIYFLQITMLRKFFLNFETFFLNNLANYTHPFLTNLRFPKMFLTYFVKLLVFFGKFYPKRWVNKSSKRIRRYFFSKIPKFNKNFFETFEYFFFCQI